MIRQDRAIILLAVGQTLAWAGIYYVFPALLLRWEETLGWTKAELTGALTLAIAVSAILSPFTGRIIDSGRGPALMGGSAVLGGLGLLALSQVQALWQFYTIWLVIGAAMAGGLYEPCFAIVTRNKGDKARGGIIFITLIAGFASTISFPTVHYLAEGMGWRNTLLIFGLIEILAVAPILGLGARRLEKTGDHAGIAPSS
ncbi:MAG: MFS transporter, partial [Paracoccaceae bacterium]|nr:MFS transporter [Paracoccaceae bacterium]